MPGRKHILLKAVAVVVSVLIAVVLGEILLRYYFNVVRYRRTAAIDRIQRHLRPHDDIGFLWEPNISHEENIVLAWADQEKELTVLCTDQWGFRNHPKAKEDRQRGIPVDVVGVGDSFIEMAAKPFYEFFKKRSLNYHSFAMHRQCTPQYNLILEEFALPLEPEFVLYGIYENDFYELPDYEAWVESDMDYFAYHSGYWCGPPYYESRFWHPEGYLTLYQALLPDRYAERQSRRIACDARMRMEDHIIEADELCKRHGAAMLLILIPGRQTLFGNLKVFSDGYAELAKAANEHGIPVLDLRPVILSHPNPRQLYYRKDGHWNLRGIRLAAEAIDRKLVKIREELRESTSDKARTTSTAE